jgi:hypothetical protein
VKRRAWAALAAAWFVACAPMPRPRVMSEVDATRMGSAAQEAAQVAPQAYAHAEQLRRRAERAYHDGDIAGAQILSEHALAAYQHAFILARLGKAEQRLAEAKVALSTANAKLDNIDKLQARVASEADALEMRVHVAENALPRVPSEPASPEREHARLQAARSIAVQAKLLCVSAGLLGSHTPELDQARAKLDALDKALSKPPSVAPIDDAITARSACLKELTVARRPATRAHPAAGIADALLAELSHAKLFPYRDDRGVVVTLRGLFRGGTSISGAAKSQLSKLGQVAKAHPDFPVLVVDHSAQGPRTAFGQKRAEAVAQALRDAGAPHVDAQAAGSAVPVVDPSRQDAGARNARTEIIFVAPAS